MTEAGQERLTALWRRLVRLIGVPLIACAASIGLAQTSWLQAIENIYYDYWHIISGVRYTPQHAAFVTVDDDTLVAYKEGRIEEHYKNRPPMPVKEVDERVGMDNYRALMERFGR